MPPKKSPKGPAAPKPERVNPFLLKKNVPPPNPEVESLEKPSGVLGKLRPLSKAELHIIISKLSVKSACLGKKLVPIPKSCSSDDETLTCKEVPEVPSTSIKAKPASPSAKETKHCIPDRRSVSIPKVEETKEHKLIRLVGKPTPETEASIGTIKELIASGVDLNHKVDKGTTPLMLAVKREHLRTAQLLLDSGAAINLQDEDGRTALNWATHIESEEMVHLLLCNKADPILRNNKGETCFYTALNERAKRMQELLAFSQTCNWRPGLPLNLLNTSDYKRNKFFYFVKSEVTKSVIENGLDESHIRKILRDSEIHTPAMEAILLEGLAWDSEIVSALEALGLAKYSKKFAKRRVTFAEFLSLTVRDLFEIGVTGLSNIEKILTFTNSYKLSTRNQNDSECD